MTAENAMQALRDAIRAELAEELLAGIEEWRNRYHPADGPDDPDPTAMDQSYLDGVEDTINTLRRMA